MHETAEVAGRQQDVRGRTERPLVSIITVVFNGAIPLEKTLHSIGEQRQADFEYLVIDGGSSDGTVSLLKTSGNHVDFWISEPDHGIYDAFNKGVRHAKGEWVLFLGAGDTLYEPDTLQILERTLRDAGPDTLIAYGRVMNVRENGVPFEAENEPWSEIRYKWRGGRRVMPCHQGVLQRKSLLLSEPFDLSYKIVADYKVFERGIRSCPPLYTPQLITKVLLGGVSTAPDKYIASVREILRMNRELGRGSDHLFHQLFYLLKCVVKQGMGAVLPKHWVMRSIDHYRAATGRARKWT